MVLDLTNLTKEQIILFNQISLDTKHQFNELTKQIIETSDGSIEWWVDTTVSRNPYISQLFVKCCHVQLCLKIQEEHTINEVITSSRAVHSTLKQLFGKKSSTTKVAYVKQESSAIKQQIRDFFKIVLKSFIYLTQKKKQRRIQNNEKPITLIDTFFVPSMFKTGKYKDRYFNGILENLSENDKKELYFIPNLSIYKGLKAVFKMAEIAEEQFIYPIDYWTLKDYYFAITRPFRMQNLRSNDFYLGGLNVSAIVKEEWKRNLFHSSSYMGVLNYRLVKRWKELGLNLRFMIDWFENQPIDKGYHIGLNKYYPHVKVIGYEGFIVDMDFNFYLSPTDYEYNAGVVPKTIGVVGRLLEKNLLRYSQQLKVKTFPAFRFKNVWDTTTKEEELEKTKGSDKTALVALNVSLTDSSEILKLLLSTIEQNQLEDIQFLIKAHPLLNLEKLKANLGNKFPKCVSFIEGDFKKILLASDILISNTSTTCLEALVQQRPVIIIGGQSGLTQNPIPSSISKEYSKIAFTEDELAEAINLFMGQKNNLISKKDAQKLKTQLFEPISKRAIEAFLALNQS